MLRGVLLRAFTLFLHDTYFGQALGTLDWRVCSSGIFFFALTLLVARSQGKMVDDEGEDGLPYEETGEMFLQRLPKFMNHCILYHYFHCFIHSYTRP